MKAESEKLKNFFKTLFKGGGYHFGQHASVDWLLAVIGFFVLSSVFVFLSITYGPALTVPDSTDTSPSSSSLIPQDLITRVLKRYEARNEQFESLLKNPVSLTDPSL